MSERSISVLSLPPPGRLMSLFHGTSELCRYSVTVDHEAETIVVIGPGLQRLYYLTSEPFRAILDSDNGSERECALVAIALAESGIRDEDIAND